MALNLNNLEEARGSAAYNRQKKQPNVSAGAIKKALVCKMIEVINNILTVRVHTQRAIGRTKHGSQSCEFSSKGRLHRAQNREGQIARAVASKENARPCPRNAMVQMVNRRPIHPNGEPLTLSKREGDLRK